MILFPNIQRYCEDLDLWYLLKTPERLKKKSSWDTGRLSLWIKTKESIQELILCQAFLCYNLRRSCMRHEWQTLLLNMKTNCRHPLNHQFKFSADSKIQDITVSRSSWDKMSLIEA